MSTPIVYEGALASKDPSQNGLFKHMRFWVAHRIPLRMTFVQMIQNNGGEVVSLEKNADYLIADHAKKHTCPPGSYSFKWIEESCKAGVLKDPANYLCVPVGQGNPVPSSSAAPKTTRNMFSEEDDDILRRWVASQMRKGAAAKGNEIYKTLEAKYPHHTYQSWRDRWIKILSRQPWPEEFDDRTPSPPPKKRTAQTPTQASPKTPRSLGRRVPTRAAPAQGRAKFTEEDDEILIEYVMECMRHRKATHGMKIFRDLAKDFPQHTEQSWRTRWVKYLEPKMRFSDKDEKEIEDTEDNREETAEKASRAARSETGSSDKAPESHEIRSLTYIDDKTSKVGGVGTPRASYATNDTAVEDTDPTEDDITENAREGRRDHHGESRTTPQAPVQEPVETATNHAQSPPSSPFREQFYRDYQVYVKTKNIPLVHRITIQGHTFDLWELWQAITSPEVDPNERDWKQIAKNLNFNWIQNEAIHVEIRDYFNKYLAGFEGVLKSFDDATDDDAEDEIEDESEDEGEDEGEDESGDEGEDGISLRESLPSLPPIRAPLKRSFDTQHSPSDNTYPQSTPKRRKIDRDTEIPSTPDDINKTSSLRTRTSSRTVINARRPARRTVDNRTEENESQDTVPELPVFETQENLGLESQCNVTPSQQLRSEFKAASPDLADVSPTPKVIPRVSNPGTPTPKRSIRNPFQEDSEDEVVEPTNVYPSNDIAAKATVTEKSNRRSLPKSYTRQAWPIESSPVQAPAKEGIKSSRLEPHQSSRRVNPPKETPEDVIDRFRSLGYPKEIVLKSLRATTWRLGDAGQVMEILKRGEELPQRTRGVWTQRDDEALKLVTLTEPPKDEKEGRKRARARERLEKKHGPELMELRRKYLWEAV
ncbi:TRF2-interacting telomeric protein/Rap1 C terminal domain-containing protein [Daldinia sp. FL1419]|nr:TRF2-interacting telomeric protein/Rap1 C terminal domain-containing protein [Daldinia sp. FL1419]